MNQNEVSGHFSPPVMGLVCPLGASIACDVMDHVSNYERLLANILRSSADAIIAMDNHRKILSWNHGAEQIYGWKAEEIVGESFEKLMPPDLLQSGELQRIDRAMAEHGVLQRYETERLTKNGRRLTIELTCNAVRDSLGHVIGRSVIHRDVTEKKRLERELIQSEKLSAIGKLSAHVAHEIRNPLSSILLNLELLGDEISSGLAGSPDEARSLLTAIRSEVEVLTRFTDEVLQFARVPRLKLHRADLAGLISELAAFLAEEAARQSVDLQVDLDPAVPQVPGDVAKLRLVLLNLARNALEAMPSGGSLELRLERNGAFASMSVKDSGTGVSPEVMPRLFDPFFTTKDGGTGLGLALSQQIVREHGGLLECESPPGEGTTFVVRLPL